MKMIQHGETSRNIADLKQEMADVKKQVGWKNNGVEFGTLIVVLGVVVGVLAYLFVSGFLVRG